MSTDAAHADHVYQSANRPSAAASSPIVASWRRCMTMHHLAPEENRKPTFFTDAEFRRVRQMSDPLIAESADELDRIFLAVGKAGCCLLLTDAQGVALDRRGAVADDEEFRALGLWSGALWSEASVGTNGIGTALADERSVVVYRDQHFFSANISLCCTTAPIRDHLGRVTGALDISTCRDDINELTFAMVTQAVRDAAQRIEGNLFRRAYPGARILMVPSTNSSALSLLAVDQDDIILGATRAARLALRLDDAHIAQGIPASDALREERQDRGSDLVEAERAALRRVLSRANGNITHAASLLGISRATLHRKMKKLSVQ
ncbi:sigma-54-dependent Fis family transcriptional regulator [Agrobacterium larrymoorei]|uniref:helix-turn-helix domain-containing protein n=1 Tax=Agrobacterium larrymoorei TaxID=160699 RepID=UPI001571708F|nr:helix-turn-helix domain-containing protein [Agrobacterium larrymoorei]NTJ42950.1 sigma-54-dependent Fis family transcriptional regulator [Agrobacterium larrymoorei]